MSRRTERDRRDSFDARHRDYWTYFRDRLATLETFAEAKELAYSGPGPDQPGRSYHSNLAFFLGQFTVPDLHRRRWTHPLGGLICTPSSLPVIAVGTRARA